MNQGASSNRRAPRVRSWLGAALVRLALRKCTRVGSRARLHGSPHVENQGTLIIGDDFACSSLPVRTHLIVHRNATLSIGHRVSYGHGSGTACHSEISIGDDTQIGSFVMILDSDFHVPGQPHVKPEPTPIRIGRNVRIGNHVTILRGAEIPDGAVIASGSVVRRSPRPR